MRHTETCDFQHLCALIGRTPLSKIRFRYHDEPRCIYVKHEHYNYTGSVKDRMALYILHEAHQQGSLKPDSIIVEATSGNTGIAFAAIGRALGHDVKIFMPDWLSHERVNLIKSFGAEVTLVSKEQGGFKGAIQRAEDYAASHEHAFLPSQFSNVHNCEAHYHTTAVEIIDQLAYLDVRPDAFVAGVGTGGTIMGVGARLREQFPHVKMYPIEPSNSPTLSTGYKVGKHRIEGISDEFIPDLICLKTLDDIIDVDDSDAILMSQTIARSLGLGVGISSGANFIGAVKAQALLPPGSVVVTMFPDDNKKYLSTDLMREEPVKESCLTKAITDLRFDKVVNIADLSGIDNPYKVCRKKPDAH